MDDRTYEEGAYSSVTKGTPGSASYNRHDPQANRTTWQRVRHPLQTAALWIFAVVWLGGFAVMCWLYANYADDLYHHVLDMKDNNADNADPFGVNDNSVDNDANGALYLRQGLHGLMAIAILRGVSFIIFKIFQQVRWIGLMEFTAWAALLLFGAADAGVMIWAFYTVWKYATFFENHKQPDWHHRTVVYGAVEIPIMLLNCLVDVAFAFYAYHQVKWARSARRDLLQWLPQRSLRVYRTWIARRRLDWFRSGRTGGLEGPDSSRNHTKLISPSTPST